MLFADIPYNDKLKKTLIDSVKNNHIAHAQLFAGADGSAKLSLALAYIQYINCEDKQENDSCGQCPSCYKYNKSHNLRDAGSDLCLILVAGGALFWWRGGGG